MREYVVENEFVKAVRAAGGVAYKLTSQTANGLPDRLVLFFPAKTVFVELKAPGKMMRPLQRKRRYQLMKLGFPVICIDRFSQIKPAIQAILDWAPGTPFPDGIGVEIPDLVIAELPQDQGALSDMDDYGDTLEPEDPAHLDAFADIDAAIGAADISLSDTAVVNSTVTANGTADTARDRGRKEMSEKETSCAEGDG